MTGTRRDESTDFLLDQLSSALKAGDDAFAQELKDRLTALVVLKQADEARHVPSREKTAT